MYLEDDWKLLAEPYIDDQLLSAFQQEEQIRRIHADAHADGNMHRNSFAMAVQAAVGIIEQSLVHVSSGCTGGGCEGREPVAEVLFNDQGTSCSARGFSGLHPDNPYFSQYDCTPGTPRPNTTSTAPTSASPYPYPRMQSVHEEVGSSGWERSVLLPHGVILPYQLHEFGLASTYYVRCV